jgi:hypothetical protein
MVRCLLALPIVWSDNQKICPGKQVLSIRLKDYIITGHWGFLFTESGGIQHSGYSKCDFVL